MSLFPPLSAEERPRFRLLALGFVCVAAGALIARAAGDALFLSRWGADLLPYMYIGSALVLVLLSLLYGAAMRRMAPLPLALATALCLAVLCLALRLALAGPSGLARAGAYFLADLAVNVPMMLFWGIAALVFNPREGKRLFGMVGAAGTAACIVAGAVVRPLAARLGTENLLLLVAALLGGFAASIAALRRAEPARLLQAPRGGAAGPNPSAARVGYWAALLKQAQIRNLATFVALLTLVLVLVDYQFKTAARARYHGAELAGFIGSFYSAANVVSLLVQLFLVHRTLQKAGILPSLAILPVGLLAASLGTLVSGAGFAWIVFARLLDPVFNFTINSAAVQMLYLGIRVQTRSQARAFVEGTCRPLAMATGGTVLVGFAGDRTLAAIGGVVAVLSLLWLGSAWANRRAYVAGLVDSVGARRFEPGAEGVAALEGGLEAHFKQSLLEASDDDLPYLVGVLPQIHDIDATPELARSLERASPQVKTAVLEYLRGRRAEPLLPQILAHLDHERPEVRLAAVHALAGRSGRGVVEALERRLDDPAPAVRAAAAVELINEGDFDALLGAGIALKAMLTAGDPQLRIAATTALEEIQHGQLTRLLGAMLSDADQEVLKAALEVAARHPDLELVSRLLPLLGDARVGAAAADALAAHGAEALPLIEAAVADAAPAALLRIPVVVARIGDPRGFSLLERLMESGDGEVRGEAVEGWCRLLQRQPSTKPYLRRLDALIACELAEAERWGRTRERVAGLEGGELLVHAVEDELQGRLRNVFALLDVRTPAVDMRSIHFRLSHGSPAERAEALELLDNVTSVEVRSRLLALLETRPAVPSPGAADAELVRLLSEARSEWIRVGALHAVGAGRLAALAPAVRAALADPLPVVRETALHALGRLVDSAQRVATAAAMRDDPDAAVRRLATELAGGG